MWKSNKDNVEKMKSKEGRDKGGGGSLSYCFLSYSNFLIRKTFAAVLMSNTLFQAEQTT